MDAVALRHFKDFLQIYNKITESCFDHCALLLTDRGISSTEMKCVDQCAQKHINVNHKVMKLYMDIQPEFLKNKLEVADQVKREAPENVNLPETAN